MPGAAMMPVAVLRLQRALVALYVLMSAEGFLAVALCSNNKTSGSGGKPSE
ncbi:hypothetical protein ABVT39_012300 [Epinephelus coioides]